MADNKEQKFKALQTTLEKLDKAYGKGTVMRLSDKKVMDVEVISTGSVGLDLALGIGGLPRGRVVEIYGPESSGKTTLTLQVIAEMQKLAGTCAFIDAIDPAIVGEMGFGQTQSLTAIGGSFECRDGGDHGKLRISALPSKDMRDCDDPSRFAFRGRMTGATADNPP